MSHHVSVWQPWNASKRASTGSSSPWFAFEDSDCPWVHTILIVQHAIESHASCYWRWETCVVVQEVSTRVSIKIDLKGIVFDRSEWFGSHHGRNSKGNASCWDACGRLRAAKTKCRDLQPGRLHSETWSWGFRWSGFLRGKCKYYGNQSGRSGRWKRTKWKRIASDAFSASSRVIQFRCRPCQSTW